MTQKSWSLASYDALGLRTGLEGGTHKMAGQGEEGIADQLTGDGILLLSQGTGFLNCQRNEATESPFCTEYENLKLFLPLQIRCWRRCSYRDPTFFSSWKASSSPRGDQGRRALRTRAQHRVLSDLQLSAEPPLAVQVVRLSPHGCSILPLVI